MTSEKLFNGNKKITYKQTGNKDNYPKSNKKIRAETVRLIDSDGSMVGVRSLSEALKLAEMRGLDLVEISPNADPPVCKVIDFGKYKYELKKKAHEAKKKQKVVSLKEIKVRPNIGENDFQVKLRHIVKFIESGDKVKVTLRFKGREITHKDLGMEVMRRILSEVTEIAKPEVEPRFEGRQILMVIGPRQ